MTRGWVSFVNDPTNYEETEKEKDDKWIKIGDGEGLSLWWEWDGVGWSKAVKL